MVGDKVGGTPFAGSGPAVGLAPGLSCRCRAARSLGSPVTAGIARSSEVSKREG